MAFLCDHPDWTALVNITAERMRLLPVLVFKDYWVTRVLRALAGDERLRGRIVFKGGTSLSKGWKVIERFSEDIDLLLTGPDYGEAPSGGGARERLLKQVRATIEAATPLRLPPTESMAPAEHGFYYLRAPYHGYLRYPLPSGGTGKADAFNTVLVEMGFRGGSQPHASVELNSFVADHLLAYPLADAAALADYGEDLAPFTMELLEPGRTLVEKLLAIHAALVGDDLERFSPRHLYDVARLLDRLPAVAALPRQPEFAGLLRAAIEVSNRFYKADLDAASFDLLDSPMFAIPPAQAARLRARFRSEESLYYGEPPTFDALLESLARLRQTLAGTHPS